MVLGLDILPVYSEYHSTYHIGSTRLLKHQVETFEAYKDPNVDVIFNMAMTGDGKSLGGYLAAFRERKSVIAMYPTNELIQDQYHALPSYQQRLEISLPHTALMFSDEITRLMREHDQTVRMEAVRSLLRKNKILLTNPDLVHLMMSRQYGWEHQRKELPFEIGAYFDYFLFDEFHVFGVPQVISVMNMLGYLHTLYKGKSDRKKFVFLSATPSKLLDRLLEHGEMRYKKINGHYSSTGEADSHRILQACSLELHEVSQDMSTETWIAEHIEDIRQFFQEHQGTNRPKAAILVYSVATARRLVMLLKERLEKPYGITIGENTGLTYRDERRSSFEKDILVGTSTVDIGVDFRINYLIFEAFNGGSFLQRFGRLGRHEGFAEYRAYGLVPRFVLERLTQTFGERDEVERKQFNEAIGEAFPTETEFENYTKRWGVVQAAHILVELSSQKDETEALAMALTEQYDQQYSSLSQPVMAKAMKRYWKMSKQRPEIISELLSFRGLSPLSCGVWDTDDHLKTYDLFFLLTNTDFAVLSEADFMEEVKRRGLEEREFKKQLLYLKVLKYIPERLNLILGLNYDLGEYANMLHQIQVLDSIFVREPRPVWVDQVNRRLKALKLPCILSDIMRTELKQRLHLGAMFPIHRLHDSTGNEYSIVFGQEALLLESLLFFRKTQGDKPLMF